MKHICLDLDSTLIHAIFELDEIKDLEEDPNFNKISNRVHIVNLIDSNDKHQKGVGKHEKVAIVKRPYVDEFIKYITKNFEVSIWSAGQFRYVRAIEYLLFPNPLKTSIIIT